MVNPTILSAILAMNLTEALYKPYPGSTPPRNGSNGSNQFNDFSVGHRGSNMPARIKNLSGSTCHVDPYIAPPVTHQEFPRYDETVATVYRYREQQSVNLGSWFVHEKWMTPSLFLCAAGKGSAEIDIASGWGSTTSAQSVLEHHWDTFITESDFRWLSSVGINTVRLPIGYWNLGPDFMQNTPFSDLTDVYVNCWSRIVRAINIAGRHGIGVLIDLHGAPGSQNGQTHSGISDGSTNLFSVPGNMDKTINVLTFLVQQLVHVNNVVGIQLLNEPQYDPELTDFYTRAIDKMRQVTTEAAYFPVYLHNGFHLQQFSQYVAGRTDFVVEDHHSYFVYTDADRQETATQHATDIGSTVSSSLATASDQVHRNLIVGEWSCALTPESMASDPNSDQARKDFCGGQMDTYANTTAGWSFWSYMKEDCSDDPGWCFKSAVGTVLPSTFFSYDHASSPGDAKSLVKKLVELVLPGIPELITVIHEETALPLNRRQKSSPAILRRFETISQRRKTLSRQNLDGNSSSVAKGYDDGSLTAKVFAGQNMSKLGFIHQYISDTIQNHGPNIVASGTESAYTDGFMRGLQEGQKMAQVMIA